MEVDHPAQGPQVADGPRPADGAASGGDDGARAGQGADGRLLRVQKGLHAPGVQQLLQERPLPLLDEEVHVHKLKAQRLGQQDAHGALARAGHADESDVIQSDLLLFTRFRPRPRAAPGESDGRQRGCCCPAPPRIKPARPRRRHPRVQRRSSGRTGGPPTGRRRG